MLDDLEKVSPDRRAMVVAKGISEDLSFFARVCPEALDVFKAAPGDGIETLTVGGRGGRGAKVGAKVPLAPCACRCRPTTGHALLK